MVNTFLVIIICVLYIAGAYITTMLLPCIDEEQSRLRYVVSVLLCNAAVLLWPLTVAVIAVCEIVRVVRYDKFKGI